MLTVSMVLHLSYILTLRTGRAETGSFSYWFNVFIFLSAVSQKELGAM